VSTYLLDVIIQAAVMFLMSQRSAQNVEKSYM